MHLGRAAVDLLPGDAPQARHRRVDLEGGLLLGHRQHRAQVALARLKALGAEGHLDVPGPARAVRHLGRQQAQDPGLGLFGGQCWCLGPRWLAQPASSDRPRKQLRRREEIMGLREMAGRGPCK